MVRDGTTDFIKLRIAHRRVMRKSAWKSRAPMKAAERLDRPDEVRERIRASMDNNGFVARMLGRELGLPTP